MKSTRRARDADRARRTRGALPGCLSAASLLVAGCSYLETVLSRTPQHADTRAIIGASDGMLVLYRQDLQNYVCESPFVLVCEGAGATMFVCQCELQ